MDQAPHAMQTKPAERDGPPPGIPVVDSVVLMGGGRELLIRHGASTYLLRVTASEKLILTK